MLKRERLSFVQARLVAVRNELTKIHEQGGCPRNTLNDVEVAAGFVGTAIDAIRYHQRKGPAKPA
jgi:hypothetical protein